MAAQESSLNDFGLIIAYLVPGATVLLGLSQFSPTLQTWFATTSAESPTIGGFLFLTVASLAVGMTVSAIRWTLVDTFHHQTGLAPPALDFSLLPERVAAFNLLIEAHYRHYQYYANMGVATAIAYVFYRVKLGGLWPMTWFDFSIAALEAIFLITSRDTLAKYYNRSRQLLN